MTAPAGALQKAVFQALRDDGTLTGLLGGQRIFDGAPAGAPFPPGLRVIRSQPSVRMSDRP